MLSIRLLPLAALALLSLTLGCSSSVTVGSDSEACSSFCSSFCSRMKTCGVGDTSDQCASDCLKEVTDGAACRAGSSVVSTYQCDDLAQLVSCASYCDSFCQKATSCDALASDKLCVSGCAEHPFNCNIKSVEPRSCDQIKSEYECYEARASSGDGRAVSCGLGPGSEGSLCSSVYDCRGDLGCSQETNLCGPCLSNDDCYAAGSIYYCGSDKLCHHGSCRSDSDCKGPGYTHCSATTYECVPCSADSHCSSEAPLCRQDHCVLCATDDDCPGGRCDSSKGCVQCKDDNDCDPSSTCQYDKCYKRCTEASDCPAGACFLTHCTEAVGTSCSDDIFGSCGGGECINVNSQNQTVPGYCTRSCNLNHDDLPCPNGYTCQQYECRKL